MPKKEYNVFEAITRFLLILAGGGLCVWLSDLIFKALPNMECDVFFEILVAMFGCALFIGGFGLFGIAIMVVTGNNRFRQ